MATDNKTSIRSDSHAPAQLSQAELDRKLLAICAHWNADVFGAQELLKQRADINAVDEQVRNFPSSLFLLTDRL